MLGGIMTELISCNTTIPTKKSQSFSIAAMAWLLSKWRSSSLEIPLSLVDNALPQWSYNYWCVHSGWCPRRKCDRHSSPWCHSLITCWWCFTPSVRPFRAVSSQEMLQTFFSLMSLPYHSLMMLHPVGASIQGGVLAGNVTDILLLDVTLLSLVDNASGWCPHRKCYGHSSCVLGSSLEIHLLDVTPLSLVDNAPIGASIQGGVLAGNVTEILLLDATPFITWCATSVPFSGITRLMHLQVLKRSAASWLSLSHATLPSGPQNHGSFQQLRMASLLSQ